MENLTKFGVTNSRVTIFAMIAIICLGALSYQGLSKREDPSITIRTAVVSAFFPGMSPERMETLIADPIERKAREISEVEDINTLITTGSVVVNLNLYQSVPSEELEFVFQDIRNKIESVKSELPQETNGPHINTDYGDVVVSTVAVTGDGYSYAELKEYAKSLRSRLYTVEGVGKVSLLGEQEERVWLEIDSKKLAAVGVQLPQMMEDLQAQNVILPAGEIDADGTTFVLEANGNLKDIESIENVLTRIPDLNTLVRLKDLVNVRRGYEEPKNNPAYYNGMPAIMVGIQMTNGQDIQVLGKKIKAAVEEHEKAQPVGVQYQFSTYQEAKVTEAINDALSNVVQTAVVVLLVLMLFLGLRPAVIVASIVPFAVAFSMVVMQYVGIELQIVSIAAVIISLGLLVDNGLVIVEDIQGRIAMGGDPKEAAYSASKQFGIPLAVASITTVSAFMPLFILEGAEGEYGFSLGAVIAFMLVGSWLTAMYILPALCVWFSSAKIKQKDDHQNNLVRFYGKLIRLTLPLSPIIVVGAYVLIVFSATLFGSVSKEMFPMSARSQFLIYIDLPKGASITETERVALDVEKWVSDKEVNPEVTDTTLYVGNGGPRFYLALNPADSSPSSAFMLVNTTDFETAVTASNRAQRYLIEEHPEARFKVKRLSLGGKESGILEIKVTGEDADRLLEIADQIEGGLSKAPGLIQNENDWGNKVVKLVLDIAQDKAREHGITSQAVSTALDGYFNGAKVSDFREAGDTPIPIVIRAQENSRDQLDDIGSISIPVNGRLVTLDQVATFVVENELSQMRRENQERMIKISAKSNSMTAFDLLDHIQPTLDELNLSDGYSYEIDGEIKDSQETNQKLGNGFIPALFVMFAAIIYQFNSIRRVSIIFMTIPFVLIGAPLALLLTGQPLSFFAILGMISLAGIIINNAIVLIDQIDIESKSHDLKEAILLASEKRVTPILLTTLTTVLGLIPMAVNGGALFEPMATLMIGGLSLASVITLFFVPSAFYLLMGKLRKKK